MDCGIGCGVGCGIGCGMGFGMGYGMAGDGRDLREMSDMEGKDKGRLDLLGVWKLDRKLEW